MIGETCLKKTISVDGDHVYVIVGLTHGAMVTGRFENRQDDCHVSMAGAERINNAITELQEQLLQDRLK